MSKVKKLTPYREVAKKALMSWYKLSNEEAEEEVIKKSFAELEEKVGAAGSMNAAIDGLTGNLSDEEREAFRNAVINKDKVFLDDEDSKVLENAQKKLGVSTADSDSVLKVLSAVHDFWVTSNAKKFNIYKRNLKKFQHLPFELIGWDEAKLDLLFVEPIYNALGYDIEDQALSDTFTLQTFDYLDKNGIHTQSDLAKFIRDLEYSARTEENEPKGPSDVAVMVGGVMTNNTSIKKELKENV